jgi:hypothetical protein
MLLMIAIKLVLMGVYSQTMQLVMDEFGQAQSARLVDAGLYFQVDPVKTVLPYAAYHMALKTGGSAVDVIRLLRAETFLVAVLIVGVTGLAAFRLHRNVTLALISVFTLLSFSNFLERSFRIRNDSFATLFAALAMSAMLGQRQGRISSYGVGALIGAAFLCTQKAIYTVLAFGLAQVALGWTGGRLLAWTLRYCIGAVAVVLVYCLAFGGWHASRVLESVLFSPFAMADHLFDGRLWPELSSFIPQTLRRNALPYSLCGLGIAVTFASSSRRSPRHVAVGVLALVVTASVFCHPQPWPYVFVTCMPFLALVAPTAISAIGPGWQIVATAIVALLLSLSFVRNISVLSQRNDDQLRVVAKAESMLRPHERYFDGIGMIPTRAIAGDYPWWWWDVPTIKGLRRRLLQGDTEKLDTIKSHQPKLWILNYRTANFDEVTASVFQDSTVRVDENIFVSGRDLGTREIVRFLNLWRGSYHLVDSTGHPTDDHLFVDGIPCRTPCRIDIGEHGVMSASPARAFLLPADVLPGRGLPVRSSANDLFLGVYTF